MENQITVLKTSRKGAKLITDGVKQTWIKPSWSREDGTFTPAAYKALENGVNVGEKKEAKEATHVTLTGGIASETEKAIYFLLSDMITKICLPKSQIEVKDKFTIVCPVWLAEEKVGKGELLSLTN